MHLLWPGQSYHTMVSLSVRKHYMNTYLDLLMVGLCLRVQGKFYPVKALTEKQLATLMRSLTMRLYAEFPTTSYKTVASPWPWVEVLFSLP